MRPQNSQQAYHNVVAQTIKQATWLIEKLEQPCQRDTSKTEFITDPNKMNDSTRFSQTNLIWDSN
jgi:hypothetical protein